MVLVGGRLGRGRGNGVRAGCCGLTGSPCPGQGALPSLPFEGELGRLSQKMLDEQIWLFLTGHC